MRARSRTTAAVLVGGVALASTAYAVGSQSSDGNATARGTDGKAPARFAGPGGPGGPGGGMGLGRLADELGVETAKLRDALGDFHRQQHEGRKDDLADDLAKALDISPSKVTAALEDQRAEHLARFASKLAGALELEAADVQEAIEKVTGDGGPPGPGGPGGPGEFVEDLAGELDIEADRLYDALREIRPERRGGAGPRGGLKDLADNLGVTADELRRAMREVFETKRSGFDDKRDQLARFLAERLDLSVDKVEDALGARPGPGGGPGGPGGGPPFGGPGGGPGGGPPGGFGGGPPAGGGIGHRL